MVDRTLRVLLLGLVSLACAPTVPRAALADWTLLGERAVAQGVERDEIVVGTRAGAFEQLRLAVHHRPVTFRDVRVHYASGAVQDVPIRQRIPRGGESRAIDLTGQDRRIARVSFLYETASTRDTRAARAVVRLYGRR